MSKTDSDDEDDEILKFQSEKDHQNNIKTRLRSVGHRKFMHKASTKLLGTSIILKFDLAAAHKGFP